MINETPNLAAKRSASLLDSDQTKPSSEQQQQQQQQQQTSSAPKKRKKRSTGTFTCDCQGCGKSFSRAEHLLRHKLNHNPLVIYKCSWLNCPKTFVRVDLRDRHLRRHEVKLEKEKQLQQLEMKSKRNSAFQGMGTLSFGDLNSKNTKSVNNYESNLSIVQSAVAPPPHVPVIIGHTEGNNTPNPPVVNNQRDNLYSPERPNMMIKPQNQNDNENNNPSNVNILHPSMSIMNIISLVDLAPLIANSARINEDYDGFKDGATATPDINQNIDDNVAKSHYNNNPVSSTSVNSWIDSNLVDSLVDFTGDNNRLYGDQNISYGIENEYLFGLSPDTYMNDLFKMISQHITDTNASQDYAITTETMTKLLGIIPSLAGNPDVNITAFQKCLQVYWQIFHSQFPFLHRPSFVASEAPGLLVLSMVVTGAGLLACTRDKGIKYVREAKNLADAICVPLRWRLFESGDFITLPVKTWVVQALLILEYYEKFFTSRALHERTFIHHGATIQLLRRTPTLGGKYNPRAVDEEFASKTYEEKRKLIWEKWIEFESLKRTLLMAFYIDSTHSAVFGHARMLEVHQIQIEMPCDDDLWESTGANFKLASVDLKPRLFLQELRGLLKNQRIETGVFGKRILMSGLLSIIFQFQQRDLQSSVLDLGEDQLGSWKEYLSFILDHFAHDAMNGCCDTKSSVLYSSVSSDNAATYDSDPEQYYFMENDLHCKYPAYHMAQIITRINHYDLLVYSGAPWRMSVRPAKSDFETVSNRMKSCANSPTGRLAVIHAFLYLFEMLLSPYGTDDNGEKNYYYETSSDAIIERSFVMYMSTLTIWAYCFTVEGPESNILNNIKYTRKDTDVSLIQSIENGYDYLRRIRHELNTKTSTVIHSFPAPDATAFHRATLLQAQVLPSIANKKNVIGLVRLLKMCLTRHTRWELAKEFTVIFDHCIERSLGSQSLFARKFFNDNSKPTSQK